MVLSAGDKGVVNPASFAYILALARAGATDTAWDVLTSENDATAQDDPLFLSLRGRLLKERAVRASGASRERLYREAAATYARSAEAGRSTYPLINAATLTFLSGERERAQSLARRVLSALQAEPEEPETPYWREATRAEALLLLRQRDESRAALSEAIRLAPKAWEDRICGTPFRLRRSSCSCDRGRVP